MDINHPDFDLIWHIVTPYLVEHSGGRERHVRSKIGQIAKNKGRNAVITAFDRLLQARPRPADPWTYFIKLAEEETLYGRPQSPAEQALEAINNKRRAESQPELF